MNQSLFHMGYRLHCTYDVYEGRVLNCYIKFDISQNSYAFELDGKVVKYGIQGKDAANAYFKVHFADIVDLDSKVERPRSHLYYVHYRIKSRNQDMVQVRTSTLNKDAFIAWWANAYSAAIANHGYELQRVEQAY